VHGSNEATDSLQDFCLESTNLTKQVFSPKVGDSINVSAARNIFQVKLSDGLISSLNTTKLGDWELAYINGVVRYPVKNVEEGGEEGADAMEVDEEDETPGVPHLDSVDVQTFHTPIVVGQIKLSEFRKVLQSHKLSTTFYKGKLIVEGRVVVMKDENGGLVVEGGCDEVFYRVRGLVYSQVAMI
jgi:cleavage and polyadenylation specificity factor subunit 2